MLCRRRIESEGRGRPRSERVFRPPAPLACSRLDGSSLDVKKPACSRGSLSPGQCGLFQERLSDGSPGEPPSAPSSLRGGDPRDPKPPGRNRPGIRGNRCRSSGRRASSSRGTRGALLARRAAEGAQGESAEAEREDEDSGELTHASLLLVMVAGARNEPRCARAPARPHRFSPHAALPDGGELSRRLKANNMDGVQSRKDEMNFSSIETGPRSQEPSPSC